ncbi:hypothetical protein [Rhodococcus sp. NPDC049939]|uniref:hypothetical protein n=1 Tax=Rhodococcus sp. NPDC049939 TaxID=3155511 RepID=UPI0033C63922
MKIASFDKPTRRRAVVAAACLGAATLAVPSVAWAESPTLGNSQAGIGAAAHAAAPDRAGCPSFEESIPSGRAHIVQPDGTVQNFDFENGEIRYAEPGSGPGEMQIMYPDGTVRDYSPNDMVEVEITDTGPGAGGDHRIVEINPDRIHGSNPC